MRDKLARLASVCAVLVTWQLPGGASAASLREAVAAAVAHNPQILEANANRRAVDEELNQARGLYLPRLDLEASAGFLYNHRPGSGINQDSRWGDQGGLIARQTLFDGGFRAAEVEKQTARVGGAALRVRERSELIAVQTVQVYLDVLRFNIILRLSDQNIRVHRDLLALVQTRFSGGTATQGEVFLAQERVIAAEAIRADVKRTLGQAEARYINLVGVRHPSLDPVAAPKGLPGSVEAAIAAARARNPSIKAAEMDVAAAGADLSQADAAFRPTIGLEGRAFAGHDLGGVQGPNHDASARLVMSWNVFNGHIDQARRRERAERMGEIESRLDRIRRDVDEAVRRAWSDVRTNDERISLLNRQIETGSRLTSAYRQEFEAGKRSMLDLLEAQNVHFNAQVQKVTATSLAHLSRYQLVAALGGLLGHFGVGPGPEAEQETRPWNRDRTDRPSLGTALQR